MPHLVLEPDFSSYFVAAVGLLISTDQPKIWIVWWGRGSGKVHRWTLFSPHPDREPDLQVYTEGLSYRFQYFPLSRSSIGLQVHLVHFARFAHS